MNFKQEPGLKESYDRAMFLKCAIQHMHEPVSDEGGAVPNAEVINRIVQAAVKHLDNGRAIAIHCKGGFGRSVLIATCIISQYFGVPGSTLLAWVRICRTGAINTPDQES